MVSLGDRQSPCEVRFNVFIVAYIRVYREWLQEAIASLPDIQVVGVAASWSTLLERLADLQVDMVLVDITSGIDLAAIRSLLGRLEGVQVVAFGLPELESEVMSYVEAGVSGYVQPEASLGELKRTLESIARGEVVCSPRLAASLMRRVAALATRSLPDSVEAGLTTRELEILELIEDGLSNKEIALALGIEVATVKKHVHNLFYKLGVRRRLEAAAWARRHTRAESSGRVHPSSRPRFRPADGAHVPSANR